MKICESITKLLYHSKQVFPNISWKPLTQDASVKATVSHQKYVCVFQYNFFKHMTMEPQGEKNCFFIVFCRCLTKKRQLEWNRLKAKKYEKSFFGMFMIMISRACFVCKQFTYISVSETLYRHLFLHSACSTGMTIQIYLYDFIFHGICDWNKCIKHYHHGVQIYLCCKQDSSYRFSQRSSKEFGVKELRWIWAILK